jgi:cysteate synthase
VEGCDLDPAAAVATASLLRATERGTIGTDDMVLLNITGGGYERVKQDYSLTRVQPACTVPAGAGAAAVKELLTRWMKDYA